MLKREFEELANRSVSEEEYKVIETVYQWHPSVKGTSGKDEVAELYKSFGMAVFYDLLPRAEKNRGLERQLIQVRAEEERIRQEMEVLSHGSPLEKEETAMELQEKPEIRQMIKVMEETLTGYFCDPNVRESCKKRMKLGMVRTIEEIYSANVRD